MTIMRKIAAKLRGLSIWRDRRKSEERIQVLKKVGNREKKTKNEENKSNCHKQSEKYLPHF